MANITFVNDAPVGGLTFNPGLEEVLDPDGSVTQHTANLFEITNASGGPFNGFKVQLTSSANNGAGDFTYNAVTPTGGKIDGITVRAPDGTVILQVTAGASGFGDQDLVDFNARIFDPNASPEVAVFRALDLLLAKDNLVSGSGLPDHATAFGAGDTLNGGGGNDLLWSPGEARTNLVGGAGNDVLRVEDGTYKVHGANADGSGGAGGTDTLEVVGYVDTSSYARLTEVTNVDVLRFVAADDPAPPSLYGAEAGVAVEAAQIGAGRLSPTLSVVGSTTDSPLSTNQIVVYADYDLTATSGVNVNLSGWTFSHWDQSRSEVRISTNTAARNLNDTIVGTAVADEIATHYGNDTIRGGGGADAIFGGSGNDTFVYGRNEAAAGELVSGGESGDDKVDKVLILADNDFTGTAFYGIDQFVFGGGATAVFNPGFADAAGFGEGGLAADASPTVIGNADANTIAFRLDKSGAGAPSIDLSAVIFQSWTAADRILVNGTDSRDEIAGSSRGDVINGGGSGDTLQGNGGADAFVFNAGFGNGVDHIADFRRKEGDSIYLEKDVFKKLKLGDVRKKAFEIGEEADSRKDRIIYDRDDGVLRYDSDGTGKHKAKIVAIFDDAAALKAGDLLVI